MTLGTTPRQSAVDLAEVVTDNTIMYGLQRVYDKQRNVFDYIIKACLPVSREMVEIVLDPELGRVLGSYWRQNEYGTFLGKHCMDWILRHLKAGLEI